jgi:hypothetical protein
MNMEDEKNIGPISPPPLEVFAKRGGRYGSHNVHDNDALPLAWTSGEEMSYRYQERLIAAWLRALRFDEDRLAPAIVILSHSRAASLTSGPQRASHVKLLLPPQQSRGASLFG